MQFYKTISPWYNQIFPFNPQQLNFVLSYIDNPKISITDIGCASGELALKLSSKGHNVTGIDSDREMIQQAERKTLALKLDSEFITANMLDTKTLFRPNSIDIIICFGNTLAHLKNLKEISNFFSQCHHILKKGGKILLQVVNYDNIIENRKESLPSIESKEVIFHRNYKFEKGSPLIRFHTQLIIKKNNHIIENEIPLFPIQSTDFKKISKETSFREPVFFGNFKKEAWSKNTMPTVVVCEK
ncbi:MAG: class I SAM-dependent methyltransferase [Bacteroidales bacterium]